MVWIALLVMMCACVAQHLGLSEAIANIILKIAKCPKCMSFWSVLLVLLAADCNIFMVVVLSLPMAYLSHWFNLVLFSFTRLYDRIWQRIQRKR